MLTTTPFLPRIYYLYPQLAGTPSELDAHLDRCAAMGFDHVLVPSFLGTTTATALLLLQKACTARRLKLLLDLDVGSIEAGPGGIPTHWLATRGDEDDDLPDPRRLPRQQRRTALRFDRPEVAGEILEHWLQRVQAWVDAGVAGFRCIGAGNAPPQFWNRMIHAGKSRNAALRFLAATPGMTPEQIGALAGCGFDATFSSGAWWDYRARWLAEEQARLCQVAPPIAFPDDPAEPVVARMAHGAETPALRRQVYLRALRLAAATGNGMLVPMGFEYGAWGMFDPGRGKPADFQAAHANAPFDLSSEIARANGFIADSGAHFYAAQLRQLTGPESDAAVLLRIPAGAAGPPADALLIVANADPARPAVVPERQLLAQAEGFVRCRRLWADGVTDVSPDSPLALEPGELQIFSARRLQPVVVPSSRNDKAMLAAGRSPRVAIEAISPSVDEGRFPAKRTVGEYVDIEADVFMDGHDKLAVALLWRTADETEWRETRMHPKGNDRWTAALPLMRIGRHQFAVEAWHDEFATYRDELEKKVNAGLNVGVELEEGRLKVVAAAQFAEENGMTETAAVLRAAAATLEGGKMATATDAERIAVLLSEPTAEAMRLADARPFAVRSEPPLVIDADRVAARFSSWYELFPRSQSGDPKRHGTFADVIRRLPDIQAMGFDTLYFPPIHPIGRKNRKGRNNSLTPAPDDPGSPYAIGAEAGGHDAIHPELGTLDDFRALRDEAARHGLELALDFAIQCSPDHPWLREHPEWFAWRPDGSLRYAENPPKKYEDIVNVDFYADGAVPALWNALRDVILFWVSEGVRVFRVDNPHTKPLPFWEWMIADVRSRHPDTIFLSEAFTRPKMMYRLAKIGFAQSYTYFTWRHSKAEFTDYLTELTSTPVRDFFRPHFFVNTPDINPVFLQRSGRPGFLIRAALATTLSGLWGMYSGFELCEGTPVPGKEEYLDSEKYEIRAWDWRRPGNIIEEITQLNRIRKENPALQTHLGIRFCKASNDNILFFLKATEPGDSRAQVGDNAVLVAINLDPFAAHDTEIELPLWLFGLQDDGTLAADDLIRGNHVTWHGKSQHLRLDPFDNPYAIWRVRQQRSRT